MGIIRNSFAWLIRQDINLTEKLSYCSQVGSPCRSIMLHLELSYHGIPWFLYAICGYIYTEHNSANNTFYQNILIGLLLDVLVVATLKAVIKRPRPAHNVDDMVASESYFDSFSFPSGHTTRATLSSLLLVQLLRPLPLGRFCIYLCCLALVCSRILLGRHHVSDVVAGVLIGYAEYRYIFLEYGVAMRYTFSSCMKIPQGAIHDLLHSVANCMFRAT